MARLAVLGGGQLGRLLAEAADALGIPAACFDLDPACSASRACEVVRGSFDDADAVRRFAEGAAAVTCEWESVPLSALVAAGSVAPLRPGVASFAAARDRFAEQDCFAHAGVRAPESLRVSRASDLPEAFERLGSPVVLKSRFGGYDGKGQARLARGDDPGEVFDRLGVSEVLAQAFVGFEREVSVVGCRGADGDFVAFDPIENEHRGGILYRSLAPAVGLSWERRSELERATRAIADDLGHVGVLAVEFFLTADGVLANEIAPRVHNSGHWTLGSGLTSQFEQHVRAVLGRPLARAGGRCWGGMINLVGVVPDGVEELAGRPGVDVRLYGKEPRPGRKLGHVSVHAETETVRDDLLKRVTDAVEWSVV
ncbi:MAG: 5-(carboxyamino)imidazole ribonucleotide synthase [Planctomycetota bacterium]